jgi:hypothetical protein
MHIGRSTIAWLGAWRCWWRAQAPPPSRPRNCRPSPASATSSRPRSRPTGAARSGQHPVHGTAGRPRRDRTGADLRAEPRRQHQGAGARSIISTAWPSCARRTTSWCSGATRTTRTTRPAPVKARKRPLKAEFTVPMKNDKHFTRLRDVDGYAPQVGHSNGFPVARDPKTGEPGWRTATAWSAWGATTTPTAAAAPPCTPSLGHAPRHLDRNITVVGRVISGMPLLSTLPRGPAPMGFYDKPEMQVPISAVKVAADVPGSRAQQVRSDAHRQRHLPGRGRRPAQPRRPRGPRYAAGHVDLCAAPIPVRAEFGAEHDSGFRSRKESKLGSKPGSDKPLQKYALTPKNVL